MVHEEGFRRARFVTSTILTIGLVMVTIWIVSATLALFTSGFTHGVEPALGIFLLFGLYMFVVGGFLKIVIWVAEGFVRGPNISQR
jgi:hypothetical protein